MAMLRSVLFFSLVVCISVLMTNGLTVRDANAAPDLTVTITKVEVTEEADGSQLVVNLEVSNIGTDTASGPFFVQLWLSTDDQLSLEDEGLDFLTIQEIESGESKERTFNVLGLGSIVGQFVVVSLDGAGVVAESNERNNIVVQQIPSALEEDGIPDGGTGVEDRDRDQNFFMATGSGSQEVTDSPEGVVSDASCVATFRVLDDETILSYTLQCFNITDVTQAHIHLGDIHNNGPNVAILFGPRDKENRTGPVNGLLQQGTVTTDDLKEEKTLAEVLQALRSDGAYLNVHTEANPKGEARGQIVAIQDEKIVDEFFIAPASGANQFPDPIDTEAKCLASFRVLDEEAKVKYKLKCWDLVGVIQAHIHLGKGTEVGAVAAFLFGPVSPVENINGKLAGGTLTDADVVLEGVALADLIDAMRFDGAYLNVHTEENPTGEVRGQISLVDTLAGGF